jgi:hypothetical protein
MKTNYAELRRLVLSMDDPISYFISKSKKQTLWLGAKKETDKSTNKSQESSSASSS